MGTAWEGLIREIVCDAGPLIHLHELGSLDLLADFQEVLIPQQVWDEVVRHRPAALEGSALPLRRVPATISQEPRFQGIVRTFSLDLGEQAALSLLFGHPEAVLLTDDAAARLASRALGFRSHGSLGVLLRSIRRGLRTPAEVVSVLRKVRFASTLHIRESLLREILKEVEEMEA
jgi:predicted nucleic acid-binding protein